MKKLVFDIETIGQDFDQMDETTQKSLTRWLKRESLGEEDYQMALDDLKKGLGFSPLTGEVVAIGVLDVDNDKGAVYYQSPDKKNETSIEEGVKFEICTEEEMLKKFWAGVKEYDLLISFNGRAFDVPFLMVRSAIHKIRPTINFMSYRYAKPSETNHLDLADQLSFLGAVRRKGSLHLWSRAFGITSPKADGVTGDEVGELFRKKEYLKIAKYNLGDLKATKELYQYWEKYLQF